MRIKTVRLVGYKRFHDLTINLGESPSRIVALVGPNGCGKSSVLDGMLFHNNAYNKIGQGNKDYQYHSLNKEPNFNYQAVNIEFVEGQFQVVRAQREIEGKENTLLTFRSPYRYNSNLKVNETKAVPELRLNNYGAGSTADIDDKVEINYRRLQSKYNNYLHQKDCKPSEAKQKIIGDLNATIKKCLSLEITSLGQIEDGKGTLYFSKPDYKDEFEFNVLSSGEKEIVDILLDIYLRSDEYNNSIYLIDEPELHINTSIQKNLLIEIDKLIPKDCQIWIATHSIGFLRGLQEDFPESQIVEFTHEHKWASQSHTLIPATKNRKMWQRIFSVPLDDLATLLAPKRIIYCEGTLSGSLDEVIFNEIFSNQHEDCVFLSATNKSESEKYAAIGLTILKKAFDGVEIRLVQDRDDDIPKPKNTPVKICKLSRRELENYLFDYDVLHESYPNIQKAAYDTLVKSIVDDDVKSIKGQLMTLCGETGDKVFRLNLARNFPKSSNAYKELESIIFGT